jgi:hypothetical protein
MLSVFVFQKRFSLYRPEERVTVAIALSEQLC